MIFVTVGTHEQQFNRLIKEVDRLKKEKLIKDDVFIQTGYSDYIPKYCDYKKFLSYDEMEKYINIADTIICHGGPATFMNALSKGKHTIIVPRLKKYNEHVNDHQLDFLKKISKYHNISFLLSIDKLNSEILHFNNNSNIVENSLSFCNELKKIIFMEIFYEK